ncbi:cytochrome b/b6 domain-containing protein [Ancylobacter sp. A5.8]|uniref:cytochrome b/b6 domain-containing protein n=1 Tax=Ancylobacter gelatini TaxID=2919920 RepID=UPI001F4DF8CC|nr:cytochrome b/b6 domain-containing protein [Ancylobacter gelatini]MCJ8141321.1 cytochrome b/b6 domain-containing protein [Ancylobacter gelatini]
MSFTPVTQASVLAWDLPTRLAKWTLAVLLGLAFATRYYGDESLVWHMRNGLAILVVLVFRLFWGLVGGSTARFAGFLRGPGAAARYVGGLLRGRPPHYLGHNPVGGWMVVALLAVVGAQALTGLFTTDDIMVDGPLALSASADVVSRASVLHGQIFELLLWLIGLHVTANVAYSLFGSDNVILAMLSGRKRPMMFADKAPATPGSILLALACLVAAAGVVFGGIWLAGGDPFP